MNILLVTGHPAQVHNMKHIRHDLTEKGHHVFWLASNKDISKHLLDHYSINYSLLRKGGKTVFSKLIALLINTFIAIRFIRKNNIDIAVSRISPYVSIACFVLGKPHIGLTDTETAGFYDKFFGRFLSSMLTAKSFQRTLRKDQIRFDGNIELFYLHPKRFQAEPDVSGLLGINKNEPFVIMRFVSWDAYHDKGLNGFTDENKINAVKAFSKKAKVFITAENQLPTELEPFKIKIPPEIMHDVLAHATLFFGESATMASESAVLGTPAIYLDKIGRGYTDEEEKYGLVYNYSNSLSDQGKAIQRGLELLNNPTLTSEMQKNREAFLKNKIDMTGFMVWFVENYPQSAKIMKENPDYQYRFK